MKTKKVSRVVVLGAAACLLIALIFICIFSFFQQEFEKTIVSATQQQLLLIAKSTASRLEAFIEDHSKVLKTLSSNPLFQEELYKGIKHRSPDVKYCPIKVLYEMYKERADALTVLDANGIMLHRHPFIEDMPGKERTDKPGIAYVIREYQPYVSELFYNNLGNLAISISEPVFYKGEFAGIVRWMIQLDTIYKRFIQPIRIGKNGYARILNSKGIMLSYHRAEHLGEHIISMKKEMVPKQDWTELENIVKKMTNGEEGVGVYHSAWWTEKEIRTAKKLTAYAPVHVGNSLWSVSVVMDYSEIAGPIRRNAIKTIGLAGLVISLFGATGIVFFRIRRKKVELETEAIYLKEVAESAEMLRKARDELELKVKERTSNLAAVNEKLLKEITERKQAEERIKVSLKEKEVLLIEIHHRVKNNLQIISGLLDLSIMRTQDQKIIDVLQDSRLRIHTMALIHEQLYKTERFDKVNIIKNIRELVDMQIAFYASKEKSIKTVVEGTEVYLTINQAIPCALVLNELISNAFKHAFKDRERGTIAVSARRAADDSVLIMVKDDGVGIPESVDINRVNTLGLKLVKNLAQNQLKGSIKVNRDNGAEIIIEFKT